MTVSDDVERRMLEASAPAGDPMPLGIPEGWKPTLAEPVPTVQCTMIKRNGERCRRRSLRGATVCLKHGASFPTVQKHAEAVVEAARLRLMDLTDPAIDVLEDLIQPGTSENVRLKASTEILDRAGIRGGFEVQAEVEHKVNPTEELLSRLSQLRSRSQAAQDLLPGIVDAEVVSDDATPAPDALEGGQMSLWDGPVPSEEDESDA